MAKPQSIEDHPKSPENRKPEKTGKQEPENLLLGDRMSQNVATPEQQIALLNAQIKALQNAIEYLREHGTECQIGDTVIVANLPSWDGWEGKLIKLDGTTAHIEIAHKKAGKKVYTTSAVNVRKYAPLKAK